MNTLNIPSNEDIEATLKEFQSVLGQAVSAWALIEMYLCQHFQTITQVHPDMSRRIFYSATSFQGRSAMIDACLKGNHISPAYTSFMVAAVKVARDYSRFRNSFIHAEIAGVWVPSSKHFGSFILRQGKSEEFEDKDTTITSQHLITATSNFGRLSTYLLYTLHALSAHDRAPLPKCQKLVEELPRPPHLSIGAEIDPEFRRLPLPRWDNPNAAERFRP